MVPKVSVLLPTYNYANCLDDSITSVLNQTYTDFELIIVDDGSSDNTDEVVQKYLSDERVRYYKNKTNLGLVGNWNKCLEYARGEYIKYICADDLFHPHLLEKYVPIMDAHPKVSIITCQKQSFGAGKYLCLFPFDGIVKGRDMIYYMMKDYNYLGEPTLVMFRKSNLYVGRFKNYTWVIDWEMWVRHLTIGDCYVFAETLCYIRMHERQVTSKVYKYHINRFEEYELFKSIANKKYNIDLEEKDIKKFVKIRGRRCTRSFYRLVPNLYNPSYWPSFLKMLKISIESKTLFDPLLETLRLKPRPPKFNNQYIIKTNDNS